MSPATRREALGAGLFTGLAAVAAVVVARPDHAAATGAHPDAELIALCDEIAELERQWAASVDVSGEMSVDDPRYAALDAHEDALLAQQGPLIARLNEMPTHSLVGFQARARLILAHDYGELAEGDEHRGMM